MSSHAPTGSGHRRSDVPAENLSVTCAISADELADAVRRIAGRVSADYAGKPLLVVGVLNGAWVFMADLVRELTTPACCDFVQVSSYGSRMVSSGKPQLRLDVSAPVAGAHLLLVDDIIDTGISLAWLRTHLLCKQPASLRLCVLLDKPARRRVRIQPDYVGFEIPDRFVVGYGIDYAHRYRELPYIGYVDERGSGHEPV